MADAVATVVELRAQGDRMIAAFDKVDSRLRKFDRRMRKTAVEAKKANRAMRSFGDFSYFKFAAVTAGLGAITGSFYKITRGALDYDRALVGVTKTTNITGAALENMRTQFSRLSTEIGVSRIEIAKIAEIAGQLGVNGQKDLLAFTETVAKLTLTTDLTGETASLALARLLKLTNTDIATGIKDVSNAIVELGNNVAARESEITDFAVQLASEFGQFGFDATEVVAFGGALAAMQGHAAAAATAFQKMLRSFTGLTDEKNRAKMEAFARMMKMEVGEATDAIESDLANLTAGFLTRLGDFDSNTQGELLAKFANLADARSQKQIPRLVAMIEETRSIVQRGVEEGKAVDFEVAARTRSTSGQYDIQAERLGVAFDSLGRQITETLLPALRKLADVAEWVAEDRDANSRHLESLAKLERIEADAFRKGEQPPEWVDKLRTIVDRKGNIPGTETPAGPESLEFFSDFIEKQIAADAIAARLQGMAGGREDQPNPRLGAEQGMQFDSDMQSPIGRGDEDLRAEQMRQEADSGSKMHRESLARDLAAINEELAKMDAILPSQSKIDAENAKRARDEQQQAYEDAEKTRLRERKEEFDAAKLSGEEGLLDYIAKMRREGADEKDINYVRSYRELNQKEAALRDKYGPGAGEGGYGADPDKLRVGLKEIADEKAALDRERVERERKKRAAEEEERLAKNAADRLLKIQEQRWRDEQRIAELAAAGTDAQTLGFLESLSDISAKIAEAEALVVAPDDRAGQLAKDTLVSRLKREEDDLIVGQAEHEALQEAQRAAILADLKSSLDDEREILKMMRAEIEADAIAHAREMQRIEREKERVAAMPEGTDAEKRAKELEEVIIQQDEERLRRAKEALEAERRATDEAAQWAGLLDDHMSQIFHDILRGTEDVREGFARMFDEILFQLERKLIVDPIVDALTNKIEEVLRKGFEKADAGGGGIFDQLAGWLGGGGPGQTGGPAGAGLAFAGAAAGGGGGGLGGLAGAAQTALSFGQMIFGAPGAAEGGKVKNPGMVIVGERGPEVLSLPRGATIEPLSERPGGGGGIVNNWNIQSEDRVAMRRVVEEMMPEINRANQGEFIKATRAGNGRLARHMRGR